MIDFKKASTKKALAQYVKILAELGLEPSKP